MEQSERNAIPSGVGAWIQRQLLLDHSADRWLKLGLDIYTP